MADQFIYLMTDTWNNGATDFAGIQMDITDSASLATSRLLDLKINGASKFKVQKDGSVTLTSADAGAAGPVLTAFHNSASPAASDIPFQLLVQGKDSAGNTQDYGAIQLQIDDPTSTTEDASFLFRLTVAGTMTTLATLSGTGLTLGTGLLTVSGGQIKFPAIQIPSADANTLDDYQVGTWTPAFTPNSGAFGTITYIRQIGKYVKIGEDVFLYGRISTSNWTIGTAGVGTLVWITGIPFLSATDATAQYVGAGTVAYSIGAPASFANPEGTAIETNSSQISLWIRDNTIQHVTTGYNTQCMSTNMDIMFNLHYKASA